LDSEDPPPQAPAARHEAAIRALSFAGFISEAYRAAGFPDVARGLNVCYEPCLGGSRCGRTCRPCRPSPA
jgi:hypothetical protein